MKITVPTRRTARLLTAALAGCLTLISALAYVGRPDSAHAAAAAGTSGAATARSATTRATAIRVPRLIGSNPTRNQGVPGAADRTGGGVKIRILHRPGEYVAPEQGTGSWSSMYQFLEYVVRDADSYWTGVSRAAGLADPQVTFTFPAPGESYASGCGATNDTTMMYCPSDDTIYFSQKMAYDLWTGTFVGPDGQHFNGAGGDFAVAYLVAHEFAHSIQAERGLTKAQYGTPRYEQHADCWSGAWARSALSRNLLDAGDVQEGLNGAYMAGDSQYANPEHHGTPQERVNAFWAGYSGGTPESCNGYLQ